MGFSRRLLIVVSALFLSLPVASASRTLRQHIETRSSLDVCATIDEYTLASVDLSLPGSTYESCTNICLCLSTLATAIQANADLRLLAGKYGEDRVRVDLAQLINSAMNKQNCYYPDNSSPACSPDYPCGYNCDSPFISRGDQCVCPLPYKLCNGVCGIFSHGCGSAAPYNKRMSLGLKGRSHGIFTHEDALATCSRSERVCGVYLGSAAFECLNTDIALESCGGCMSPNPFLYMSEQGAEGVDCTNIPHVQNVRCSRGRCLVERCEDGFFPSSDRSECVCEHDDMAQPGQHKIIAPVTHWG